MIVPVSAKFEDYAKKVIIIYYQGHSHAFQYAFFFDMEGKLEILVCQCESTFEGRYENYTL